MRGRAALAALGLLAACEPRTVTPAEAEKALSRGAEELRRIPREKLPVDPDVKATTAVSYLCEGNLPVTAVYGTGPDGRPDVVLVIQGVDVRLSLTPAASGSRYAGEPGFSPGNGAVWWVKGEVASLAEYPAGTDSLATAVVKRTCRARG
ncbi:MAG: MliC family protein [Sphingomonadaceae bacterium]|uniref:MliC family protein n=1 Tax=Thermaurantiacus sp. TaxID=2820283 RepID=UPI00298F0222|nr:MliC family protein [Thermaurantiacus sp.]MCS6986958.1 MliC family protein [Sphingomonadaceae bacterium]MDW8415442.1 MliC family protein [Thermaurantiacus sp.]